jgi:cytochrome d ubiquinol oxidase subunit II
MVEVWYALVTFAACAYVVLDGFDLGAGALHLFVARTDDERRAVIAAIGPYWDGNEVWLLAIAGALFVGFPSVLAAAFSGMYLAMFLVVWALVFRGVAIEMRGQSKNELWRALWDFVFAVASASLPVLFGLALGNLLRGFPLDPHGMVVLPLFVDFTPAPPTGLVDWYTALVALFALVALALHAALFLASRTDGDLRARCARVARAALPAAAATWIACGVTSAVVAPLTMRPLAVALLALAVAALAAVLVFARRERFREAFLASSAFLASNLAGVAAAAFPTLLRSVDGTASVTAYAAAASPHALRVGAVWFPLGVAAIVTLFVRHYRATGGPAK